MTIEKRFLDQQSAAVEYRAAEDSKQYISGYGAVFYDGTPATQYNLWPGCVERIAASAFANIAGMDVRGLFNHNMNFILGRTSSGTMKLSTDAKGLKYDIELPDTQCGRDLKVSIDRRDITGSSFSFIPSKTQWSMEKIEGIDIEVRTIMECEIVYDVGPVTYPAYEGTDAGSRKAIEAELAEFRSKSGVNNSNLEYEKQIAIADMVIHGMRIE